MPTAIRSITRTALGALALLALAGCHSGGESVIFGDRARVEARIVDVDELPNALYRVEVELSNEGTRDVTVDLCYGIQRRVAGAWVPETRVQPVCPLSPASILARGGQVTSEAMLNMSAFTADELEGAAFRLVYFVVMPGGVDADPQPTATESFSLRFLLTYMARN